MTARPIRHREIHRVLQSVKDLSPTEIARKARRLGKPISAGTVSNLRKPVDKGGTCFPQMWTLEAIARVGGLKYDLVPIDDVRSADRSNLIEARP